MCGIAGYFGDTRGSCSSKLKRMCKRLEHRGPDGTGFFEEANILALGHTRLAIQDLSNAGKQPMQCYTSRFVISFNGEIYNHFELRKYIETRDKTINWRGHSDTETFIEHVRVFGVKKTIEVSRGMYAFGQKPLYIYASNSEVAFASELPALMAYFDEVPNINHNAILDYITLSFIPSPKTIYEGIYKLRPGELKVIEFYQDKKTIKISEKFSSQINNVCTDSRIFNSVSAEKMIEELLIDSINEHTISDKPIGVFLSGGIDSSLIAAILAQKIDVNFTTYTIGFENSQYDETLIAKETSNTLGVKNITRYISETELLSEIENFSEMQNEPFSDMSLLSTNILSRLASEDVSVCLGGDGADELFGGYNRHIAARKLWPINQLLPKTIKNSGVLSDILAANICYSAIKKISRYNNLTKSQYQKIVRLIFSENENIFYLNCIRKDFQMHTDNNNVNFNFDNQKKTNSSILRRIMDLDSGLYLSDNILMKSDTSSMRYSLEQRSPYLDQRLKSISKKLPDQFLIQGTTGKIILRKLLKKYLPNGGWNLRKKGFTPPMGDWLRGPLKDLIGDNLNSEIILDNDILCSKNILNVWDEHLRGDVDASEYIWSLFCLVNFVKNTYSSKF
jgi:asparagine synthase (glutamine-hydrolysing)